MIPPSPGRRAAAAFLGAALLCSNVAWASDWPQWRGPQRDGTSQETGWKPEGENLWSVKVGLGYSGVAVREDVLYTMGFDESLEQDTLYCLDVESGEELWSHSWDAKIMNMGHGGGTLVTPAIDGDFVYSCNRMGVFYCFSAEDGEVIWSKDLRTENDLALPTWGFSASPFVLEDMIVINMGIVFAFDKESGDEVWKTAKNYGHAYSTPSDFEWKDRSCLAVFNGDGLIVLDRTSGEEVLTQEWKTRYEVNAASPIVIGDRIFISSGYNRGCAMVSLKGGDPEISWESKAMKNHMSGCVVYDDHLFGFDESVLKCLDLDGKVQWQKRGLGKGALMLADGKLIVLSGKGDLIVAKATSKGFEPMSQASVLSGSVCWTPPVIADGRIYCRNQGGDLVCRDHRADAQ